MNTQTAPRTYLFIYILYYIVQTPTNVGSFPDPLWYRDVESSFGCSLPHNNTSALS